MTSVYKHYDQAGLNDQFVLKIDDLDTLLARRQQAASDTARRRRNAKRLAYGEGAARMLDLYPADAATGPTPVQIFTHGGFWRSLSAADFAFVPDGFCPHGAATIVLDYPLIPDIDLDGIVAACAQALSFVHRNAGDLGIDPARMHISGNSAGGHLVAELADPALLTAHGLPDGAVASATAISGLFELAPVALSMQNDTLHLTDRDVATRSPHRRVPSGAPPMLVAVGGDETQEFLDQSSDFAAAYASAGNACDLLVVPDADHVTVVLDHFANPAADLNQRARAAMGLG